MQTGKIASRLYESMKRKPYVLCICEGTAEEAVMDFYSDVDFLIETIKKYHHVYGNSSELDISGLLK